MRDSSSTDHRSVRRALHTATAGLSFLCAVVVAAPASSQDVSATVQDAVAAAAGPPRDAGPRPMCLFRTESAGKDGSQLLHASCQGRGLPLGPAETYEVFANPGLRATLIDIRSGGDRRVLLISLQDEGPLLVEDLSGELALAAGRGPMSDLAGIEIDLSSFAADGAIIARGSLVKDAGTPKAGRIAVGEKIALERSRRAPRVLN